MMSRIRVGLAGAGMVSAFHLPAWRALSDRVELIAVADPDTARAQALALAFGVPRVWRGLDEMLANERLDAVDVMTPPSLHGEHCRAAASAGAAVLCQKPLAPTLDEAVRLTADIEGRVRLMVHENWRFRPHYRQVHRWLARGCIGDLEGGDLRANSSGLLVDGNGSAPALVRQPLLATLPRMMIAEVLVHHLDVARWLVGATQLVDASIRHEAACITGESAASIRLCCDDAVPFVVSGNMADAQATPALRDELSLQGSRGRISLRGNRLRLQADDEQDVVLDLEADYRASYAAAIAHFVDALRSDGPFETSPASHLEVLATVDAAYRHAAASSARPRR